MCIFSIEMWGGDSTYRDLWEDVLLKADKHTNMEERTPTEGRIIWVMEVYLAQILSIQI